MRSAKIRKRFLSFFERRGHRIVPSSSLVPNDPTLLLTAAGMVQFKPIFQGERVPEFSRAASCQKCVRTTDIDNVGHTARHLTFFEMLGNFSFGDYYKKEASTWAWEFLTEDLKIDASRFWITIFRDDDEAFEVWNKSVGISEKRIVRLGEDDNFWAAGPTGPCGPCSELIYDLGEDVGCGRETCTVGCDCDRFLEVWNLVFMQFDRDEKGNLNPLPNKNIDTGLGLERVASVLQNVSTNFETDLIKPIVLKTARLAHIKYQTNAAEAAPLRIIADHARAVTFLINDGVLPSNEGRGYVLRRLIRRGVRYGRLIGIDQLFLAEVIAEVIGLMEKAYPDIAENGSFISKVCQSEEERFSHTLKSGMAVIAEVVSDAKRKKVREISGEVAFQLYDTYGFPLELTKEISAEDNLNVDVNQFEKLMKEQKEKARTAWGSKAALADNQKVEAYNEVYDKFGDSDFVGYEADSAETKILAIIKDGVVAPRAEEGENVDVILEKSPFYAEMGGQIGDRGTINTSLGQVEVDDAQSPIPNLLIHRGKVTHGSIKTDEAARVLIDTRRRKLISRNHTATHLLHWALRKVLGEHVRQSGSLVDDERFRFDFTHMSGLKRAEIQKIERIVNDKIFESHPVRCYVTSLEFAKEIGAIALFGEKYGKFVRIVETGGFSRELCGGTHVGNTSEIGMLKIVSEGSVGASLRRIEAVTSYRALDLLYAEENDLHEITRLLKIDAGEAADRIKSMISQIKRQQCEIDELKSHLVTDKLDQIICSAKTLNGHKVVLEKVEAQSLEDLRRYVDLIRGKIASVIIVLAASAQGKAFLVSAASADLVAKGFHAGKLLQEIAPLVGGGGGGHPALAQAGGKVPEKIPLVLEKAWEYIQKTVK